MRHFLLSLLALLCVSTMVSADPTVDSDGVFDLSVAGNDGNASYYSYNETDKTCTFTFPYWVSVNTQDGATHYASSSATVDVNKEQASEAGLTEIPTDYTVTEGDVYYKVASAWDCAGWGWWSTAYDVTAASYNTITAVVNTDNQVKIVAQGSDWQTATSDTKNVTTAGTAEEVTLVVDLTTSEDVMTVGLAQLYFQNSVVGQVITVKSITFSYEEGTEESGDEKTLDIIATATGTGDWSTGGTNVMTTNADGTVTLEFPTDSGDWSGLAWTSWGASWNLSGYDGILVTYDPSTITGGGYIQLFVGVGEGLTKDDQTFTGTIDFKLADYVDADFSSVGQVAIQNSVAPLTVTITSIVAYCSSTGTAISLVSSDTEVVEVARYNLMGQKISGAEKGINIIVYSDGSAKKVLVK